MATKNTSGGGAQTNVNGLHFEEYTALTNLLPEITRNRYQISNDNKLLIDSVKEEHFEYIPKGKFRSFLKKNFPDLDKQIKERVIWSKELRPDQAMVIGNTVIILESKTQSGAGSVDEKLQTCDFKKKQFLKLFEAKHYSVEYVYLLSEWYERPEYNDVKKYIEASNCKYIFPKTDEGGRILIGLIEEQLQKTMAQQ